MTEKMIIAVVGATGRQGGGLVRAILADPQGPFTVRALTRNADSGKAHEFASQGVEVVEADLDDAASVRTAFDRAYGAFVVTNFWAQQTPEEEQARTRAEMELAQAAAATRLPRTRDCGTWCGPPSRTPGRISSESAATSRPSWAPTMFAFRREGRSECVLHQTRSAEHLPADDLLLRGIPRRWARPAP
jgi:hypothetical protein